MSAEMKKIQTQTKEMRTRVTVNGDGGSGDELKPLPPTANLFVDFCDHLFFMVRHILVLDLERLDKQILICKESGIFRLENHGVPLKLTSQLQEISESLLSLPFEEKQELFAAVNSPLLYFWGTPALNRSGDAFKRGTQASYVNMVEVFNVPLSSLPKLPVSTCDDGAQHSKLEPFR
ncbi:hypothetical protein IGI04_040873 [Brassica rapa subsp. trilocularis]|uniref:Non-haem dioxygenase N-terminal domain-containing protein n=1 Tax=Brassica rapa subsp. trilocularis TaxID=1813537 RepID=A0ABQ7KPT9_BRACM|nr:hypothetical protein IGI04_040873 [Brassica rapa subsp. trilocularis]